MCTGASDVNSKPGHNVCACGGGYVYVCSSPTLLMPSDHTTSPFLQPMSYRVRCCTPLAGEIIKPRAVGDKRSNPSVDISVTPHIKSAYL